MTKRPPEIQTLIEWLKEPGREVARGWYYNEGLHCSMGKLLQLTNTPTALRALTKCGLEYGEDRKRVYFEITRRNDDNGPLAVAAYLESEFPQ